MGWRLEVIGQTDDKTPIWKDAEFPARLKVKPLLMLLPTNGIPMSELKERFILSNKSRQREIQRFCSRKSGSFKAKEDGDLILCLLRDAEKSPVSRPVDAKKLARKPFFNAERKKGKQTIATVVSVPESEEPENLEQPELLNKSEIKTATTRHTEIQYQLMILALKWI